MKSEGSKAPGSPVSKSTLSYRTVLRSILRVGHTVLEEIGRTGHLLLRFSQELKNRRRGDCVLSE